MRAGGVFVHQRVAHGPLPPALLHDPLALAHAVHRVHRQVPHVHAALWVLLQLSVTRPKHTKTPCHPGESQPWSTKSLTTEAFFFFEKATPATENPLWETVIKSVSGSGVITIELNNYSPPVSAWCRSLKGLGFPRCKSPSRRSSPGILCFLHTGLRTCTHACTHM